jgi:hypothetical protein
LTFEVIYLVKYFSGFIYFTSHATKKQLKKAATSKDMYCHICQRLSGIISWFLFHQSCHKRKFISLKTT